MKKIIKPTQKLTDVMKLQRTKLSSRGTLDFSNSKFTNLSELGNQKCLKTLILNGMPIDSLETIPPQPFLQTIKADDSEVSSFAGLSRHRNLKSISFKNTPLSKLPNFRLCCAIVCRSNLVEINGEKITREERQLARKYPPIARILIEGNWKVVVPPPSTQQFRQIAIESHLTIQDVDPDFSNEVAERYLRSTRSISSMNRPSTLDDEFFINEDEDPIVADQELVDNLIDTLSTIGIKIPRDDGAQDDILDALEMLSIILQDLRPSQE